MKAIFFDLDDVLVFSESAHNNAWRTSLSRLGVDPTLIDFESMVGSADLRQAEMFVERFELSETPFQICEHKRLTFLEMTQNGFESAAGRNALLQYASSHFTTAVVSSSPQTVIHRVLATENIAHYFNFIIGFEDCEKHKPHPTPYLNALKKANLTAADALVIEDSPTGIQASLNAGIQVFGLLKNQRPEQIVKDVKYFSSFTDIHNALMSVA